MLAVIAALPMTVLTAVVMYAFTAQAIEEAEERVLVTARSLAADVDREFDQALMRLQILGSRLKDDGDLVWLDHTARGVLGQVGYDVVVHDATGRQVFNSAAMAGEPLPMTANSMLLAKTREDGTPTISNLVLGSFTKRPMIAVSKRLPQDAAFATIALTVYPDRLTAVLEQSGLLPSTRWAVIDRANVFVARSHDAPAYLGKRLPEELVKASTGAEGVGWTSSVERRPILRGYARSLKSGFLIATAVDADDILAPLWKLWTQLALGATGLMVLAVGGAYGIGRHLAGRLKRLSEDAAKVGQVETFAQNSFGIIEFDNIHAALSRATRQLVKSETERGTLMQETMHRLRNQLAVVSTIATNTIRRSADLAQAAAALEGRLMALKRGHDVLSGLTGGASLKDLIDASLVPFSADQHELVGPPITLGPIAAQRVSLLMHELATNAVKHGALSTPSGRVAITWTLGEEGGELDLVWREKGGPTVKTPTRKGFGSDLMRASALDVDHPIEMTFNPCGVECRVRAPSQALAQ